MNKILQSVKVDQILTDFYTACPTNSIAAEPLEPLVWVVHKK